MDPCLRNLTAKLDWLTIFNDQTTILTCIPIFEMADLVIPLVSMGTTIRDLFW